jgi:hypothetical protein
VGLMTGRTLPLRIGRMGIFELLWQSSMT